MGLAALAICLLLAADANTQLPSIVSGQSVPHDNDRSYANGYDALSRLVTADFGALDSSNTQIVPAAQAPKPLQTQWLLDNLGNWAGEFEPEYEVVEVIPEALWAVLLADKYASQRAYFYGPEYVDELVAQLDSLGQISYVLQDANFNVTALVWGPTLPTTGPPVQVQYTYTPYGELLYVEDLWPGQSEHLQNRAGFQGLFFERLDGPVGAPPLAVGGRGLYHVRNRWYEPRLGRFTSRDPNESAQPLLTALASNGDSLAVLLEGFDLQGLYGDGANLFAAFGGNPLVRGDALGLEWGWDGEIDDAIADRTGHALYALGVLNEGARIASIGLQTSIRIAGSLLPGSGLYDAFQAVQVLANGRGGFWEALDIAMVAFPAAKLATHGLTAMRGLAKSRLWLTRACRIKCFIPGTEILTPAGAVPIEHLSVGDRAITFDPDDPSSTPCTGTVQTTFRSIAHAITWLSLSNGHVLGTTPGHELYVMNDGWVFAGALYPGALLMSDDCQPVLILDVWTEFAARVVYSLEIESEHTFVAAGVCVHNSSCPIDLATRAGSYPSWTTVQRRYWSRFGDGRPPTRVVRVRYEDGSIGHIQESMELHHLNGRTGNFPHDINNLIPVWPSEHALLDPQRRVNYVVLGVWD